MSARIIPLALVCALAALGCRSKTDDGGPSEQVVTPKADPAIAALVDDAGDRALLTVVVQPAEAQALVGAVARRVLATLPGVPLTPEDVTRGMADFFAALPGLDPQRPVVAALFEAPLSAPPGALALQLPDPTDRTARLLPIRHRLLLPATDPQALAKAVEARITQLPGVDAGQVFAEEGRVRVELAQGVAPLDWANPGGRSARTPAHAALVSADGAPLRVLIRPWHFRAVATVNGAWQIAMALAQASTEVAPRLAAAGMAELVGAEPMMTAEGAEFDDWMLGLDGGEQGLEAEAVITLTATGRALFERRGRAAPLKAGAGVVSAWSLSGDLRAMLDAATVPAAYAGERREVAERFMMCGPFCSLHGLTRRPFGATKAALGLMSNELPMFAGEMRAPQLAFFGMNGAAPRLAAAWQVPATADLTAVRQAVAAAPAPGVQLWTRPLDGGDQAVIVGMGVTAEAFGEPVAGGPLGRVMIDPQALTGAPPEVRQALQAFGGVAGRLDVAGGALVGQLRLGFEKAPTAPPTATRRAVFGEGPLGATEATPGSACLLRAAVEARRALTALASADDASRGLLGEHALVALRGDLACAEAEEALKPAVQGLRRLLLLSTSLDDLRGWQPAAAVARLKPLCDAGDATVCRHLKGIEGRPTPALPSPEAIEPAIEGCPAPLGAGAALRAGSTGRWLGAEKLADGAEGAARLRGVRDVQLGLDGKTPWREVRPLIQALAAAEVDALTLVVERDGQRLGVPVRLRREAAVADQQGSRRILRRVVPRGTPVAVELGGARIDGLPVSREALRAKAGDDRDAVFDLLPAEETPWRTVVEQAEAACGGAVLSHLAHAPGALIENRLGQGALEPGLLGRLGQGGVGLKATGGVKGEGLGFGQAPKIRLPSPTIEGGPLGKDVIRRVIRRHTPQVRYCYQRELAQAPTLAGKLTARFAIGTDGNVSAVEVDGDLDNAQVQACVERVVKRMRFPSATPETRVSYPFIFQPK